MTPEQIFKDEHEIVNCLMKLSEDELNNLIARANRALELLREKNDT